ncbi:MAG TPA: transposase family protein [Streptosporangiaceae bacterium]|nr:transposase family protein [Streptosporangiaceae bacterium]
MSHSAFTGISRHHLGRLVAELAGPWQARRESDLRWRRGHERRREEGAGRRHELAFTDRVLVTLAVLRLQIPHAALAAMYGVDRSTVTRAVHEVRPLLAGRGYATAHGRRLHTMADVLAYAAAHGVRLRADGSEIQVRRPPAQRPGRRAFVSGKKKMNTIKFTKFCDERGRTLWDGTFRPGRMHDQTALQSDGIDDLLDQFPDVRCEMDAGYRGLHRDHPGQVSVPPKKPARDAAPEATETWQQARHDQSSTRICVEQAIADSKHWRSLQRWTGRREYLPETIQAIGSLVSDRAAAR